jgi:hypothetical protein
VTRVVRYDACLHPATTRHAVQVCVGETIMHPSRLHRFQGPCPTCGPMDGCPFHQEVIPESPPVTRSRSRRCLILSGFHRSAARVAPLVAPFCQRLVYVRFANVLNVLVRRPLRAAFPADRSALRQLSKRYHNESHPTATPRIIAKQRKQTSARTGMFPSMLSVVKAGRPTE